MQKVEFSFDLGSVVKEKVTGLVGVVMSQTVYFTGCKHYGVQQQSLTADGKMKDWEYIDESRLIPMREGRVLSELETSTSAPGNNPPCVN
jgi:hypothetical protein